LEVEVLGGELVPLLARDLARLAPDAEGGVGEEAIRAPWRDLDARRLPHLAKRPAHRRPSPSRPARRLQVRTFASWIVTFGSPTRATRSLAAAPVASPSYPKCQGKPTWWTIRPATRRGRSRRVTSARASTAPRAVVTVTQSPVRTPCSAASSGLISTKAR